MVFGVAAAVALLTTVGLTRIERDERPELRRRRGELSGLARQSALGFRTLIDAPGPAPAPRRCSLLVVFFEGTADVLVVILALDLLHLAHGSVGFLNAAWGIGALLGGAGLLGAAQAAAGSRSRLAVGSVVIGARRPRCPAPGPSPSPPTSAGSAIGLGYTFIEVAAKTLLQRLGSDETLGRVIGSLESARLAAMALGSISASLFFELLGIRGSAARCWRRCCRSSSLLVWTRLRAFEVGAPVAEEQFQLLREQLDLHAAAGRDAGADQPRPGPGDAPRQARR